MLSVCPFPTESMGFKTLDASKIKALEILNLHGGAVILAMFNEDMTSRVDPTFIQHHKFSMTSKSVPKEEHFNYFLVMLYLVRVGGVPIEMFAGKPTYNKCGSLIFEDNEYKTNFRLWSSKEIGKSIVFEVSVAGYKGAVEKPVERKPEKKIVVSV